MRVEILLEETLIVEYVGTPPNIGEIIHLTTHTDNKAGIEFPTLKVINRSLDIRIFTGGSFREPSSPVEIVWAVHCETGM